ncbi:MAG: DUF2244 domain-containing protein [Litoreibacter sp.]
MPIELIDLSDRASDYPEALSIYNGGTPPVWRALLYPHRSLPQRGFVIVIAVTSLFLTVPLLPLVGTVALWGLLPFLLLTIAALWYFIMRNYRDGHIVEEISLWSDHMSLVRLNPRGPIRRQEWSANPYWVTISQHQAPVLHYLTLKGGPREVELGSFLSADERLKLKAQIEDQICALK